MKCDKCGQYMTFWEKLFFPSLHKCGESEMAGIARNALDMAKQQKIKVVCRLTTVPTWTDEDKAYLEKLASIYDSKMFQFYITNKREQIISIMARYETSNDAEKLRYLNWIEGIDFLLEGMKIAKSEKGEPDAAL